MTFLEMLARARTTNNSILCVGLDPDPSRFPGDWKGDTSKIYDFCMMIAGATCDLAIAFKPQIAYFAAHRAEEQLEWLMKGLREIAPHVPRILDAKRGDIGATAEQYAKEAFERYGADAVTLSPYLGLDTIGPYMEYADKGLFLLCKTSNPGSDYLQNQTLFDGRCGGAGDQLYEHIARTATNPTFDKNGQIGLVVGATYSDELRGVRKLAPKAPLLIPGIGAQGGDVEATVAAGWSPDGEIVVNSSREVLYGPKGQVRTKENFAAAARAVAAYTRDALNAAVANAASHA